MLLPATGVPCENQPRLTCGNRTIAGISGIAGRLGSAIVWHGERSMAEQGPRSTDDRHGSQPGGVEPGRQTSSASTVGRDEWPASASFGWLVGTILLLLSAAAVALLVIRVPASSGGQRIGWIVLATALTALTIGIAILLRALPTLRYRLTDEALVVEWIGDRRVVPYDDIGDVTFEPHQPLRLGRWEPFWPGYYVATVRTPGGTWHTWATQEPRRRVRITTSRGIVAISPERPVRFVAELERRMRASDNPVEIITTPAPPVERDPVVPSPVEPPRSISQPHPSRTRPPARTRRQSVSPGGWVRTARDLFRDQLLADQISSGLVAVGVVLPVLMVAYLYSQYEGLPAQIPVRWDASGDVAEFTSARGVWRFPRIAVILLVFNTALATLLVAVDRYLARMLLAAIPLTQVLLFIALVRAVS